MKKVIFLLLLNSLLMFNCALAFPTVRQVMDFEIGDMFHYQFQTATPPIVQYYIESHEVIGKQYNLDSTSVSYQFKRIRYKSQSLYGRWCDVLTETFTQTYTNLDSSCISLYPVYCAQNPIPLNISNFTYSQQTNSIYQGRTLVNGKIDDENYVTCVAGLGFVAYNVQSNNIRNLVWYKKGNETYGTPIVYLQNGYNPYANVLTRGDVYDFEVGDVIQMSVHDHEAMSYNYTYQVSYNILSKTQTDPNYVLYTVLRKRQWVEGDIKDFYFSQDTINLSYGTLNAYVGVPCEIGIGYKCDSLLLNSVTVDFPATFTNDTYIKGVGHFYMRRYSGSYYEHVETPTYWFKAAENKSCGTFFTFNSVYTGSVLRERDVFDFAAGDVFQFEREYKNPTSSTYMVQHKILAKTETNTQWTYKIQRKQQLIAGDTLGFYLKKDTIWQVYDKLDNWVAPIPNLLAETYNLCEPILANEYNNFPLNPSTRIKDLYIKGLGVYRDSANRFQEQLMYYHKVSGNKTCGTFFQFDPKIPPSPTPTPTDFMAYYIPDDKIIKMQIPENEAVSVIEIINFQGQKIYQIEVAPKQTEISISTQKFTNQVYIVRLLTSEKQSYQKVSVIR